MGGRCRVTVILPWAVDNPCPHRRAALDWVASRWKTTGHQVLVGEHVGPWCKAGAVADALPRATGDVLVIADADVWCTNIDEAINRVRSGAPWAIPHTRVHRLSQESTRLVLAGADPNPGMGHAERPYTGFPGGGIVVLPRRLYEEVPFDSRFVGWSGEDESAALAWTCLAGQPWRGTHPLWHLYHPPQLRMSRRWGSPAARALAARYRKAARSPQAMRAILDETRTVPA